MERLEILIGTVGRAADAAAEQLDDAKADLAACPIDPHRLTRHGLANRRFLILARRLRALESAAGIVILSYPAAATRRATR